VGRCKSKAGWHEEPRFPIAAVFVAKVMSINANCLSNHQTQEDEARAGAAALVRPMAGARGPALRSLVVTIREAFDKHEKAAGERKRTRRADDQRRYRIAV
jgi:hypothetical protein